MSELAWQLLLKYQSIVKPFHDESDRAAAIVGAALLDTSLEKALAARLVDDPKVSARFLSQDGALATFSSRIDLAYLVGLVSVRHHRDLNLIRKVRNEFAHKLETASFDKAPVCDLVSELGMAKILKVQRAQEEPEFPKRSLYLFSIAEIVAHLSKCVGQIARIVKAPSGDPTGFPWYVGD